jgi:hypothetical protein
LGNDAVLAQALGPERVARGITTLGATLLGPGKARSGGEGPVTLEMNPRGEPLLSMLRRAGLDARVVEDAAALIWNKLIVSAAINPLTALLRVRNGELLEIPSAGSWRVKRPRWPNRSVCACRLLVRNGSQKMWRGGRRRIFRPCFRMFCAALPRKWMPSTGPSSAPGNRAESQHRSTARYGRWCGRFRKVNFLPLICRTW